MGIRFVFGRAGSGKSYYCLNQIKKKLNNSQDRFYGKMSIPGVSSNESIVSKINKIFSSKDFVYKSRCRVYFESDVKECTIVGKTSTYLLTLKGEKLPIKDIKNIEKV